MKKFLVLILFVVSIVAAGWAINDYATSGEQVVEIPLKSRTGSVNSLSLDPSMSPARAFLKVRYEVFLHDISNDVYLYDLEIKDPAGTALISEKHIHTVKQEDKGSSTDKSTARHILGTFDVAERGDYSFDWSVQPKKGKVKEMSFELRRNVEGMNIPLLVLAALCFLLGWIVLLSARRNRRSG